MQIDDDITLASRSSQDGTRESILSLPGIHCGGCISRVEGALSKLDGVTGVRVNLSAKRAIVHWRGEKAPPLVEALKSAGFAAHVCDDVIRPKDDALKELIRALAIAGFALGNIMLLSVAVWSGAGPEARVLFHWLSALIALPAVVYSGRVFFRSAWGSLRHGRANMDVPISLGVILALALSVYKTAQNGEQVYFEASVALLFFLLIGRTLDHMMRDKARSVVTGLERLMPRGATVITMHGDRAFTPAGELQPGMTIELSKGERVPADCRVIEGRSDVDRALVNGESTPVAAAPGTPLQAGTLNLTGALKATVTATVKDSFLSEILHLMERAQATRATYRRIADRAARLYAPIVHLAALSTFAVWLLAGGDVEQAATVAIAVLIITCPCALGLAVPMVHVVTTGRFFGQGIVVKDGGALERLARADIAVFDKTGTLTLDSPILVNASDIRPANLNIAAAMAACSAHPYARAIAAAAGQSRAPKFGRISEHPGQGIEAIIGKNHFRLGRADWAVGANEAPAADQPGDETCLAKNGVVQEIFQFTDHCRPGAADAIRGLRKLGIPVQIISGDTPVRVARLAQSLGVCDFRASMRPQEKVEYVKSLSASGYRVLMIGDGLNDTPALVEAHASIAPSSAADIGRNAADFVLLDKSLAAIPLAVRWARKSARIVSENIGFAIVYNAIALPFAFAGYVTPLVAALAMSSSSIIVIANALRMKLPNCPERSVRHVRQDRVHHSPPTLEAAR